MGKFLRSKLTKPVQIAIVCTLLLVTYLWVVITRSPEMCEVNALRVANGGMEVPQKNFDIRHQADRETFWSYTYFVSLNGENGKEITTEKALCYTIGQRVVDSNLDSESP